MPVSKRKTHSFECVFLLYNVSKYIQCRVESHTKKRKRKDIKLLEGDVPEYVNERVVNRSQEVNLDENAAVLCPNDADCDETLSSKMCENVKNVR